MNFLNNLLELIKSSIPPIHKEGHLIIFIFASVTLVLISISQTLGWIGVILSCWCVYFFRDPARLVPEVEGLLVSPADGLVQKIEKATPPAELGLEQVETTRISIFLNVFNVHVNRVPVAGEIIKVAYHPGKFLSANLDKASDENERNSIIVKTKEGKEITIVQIAGLVARRIVSYAKEGQNVVTGERYGIIRFGSRVDIYLPDGVMPLVVEGQTALGGETIIADLKGKQSKRKATKI